MLSLCVQPEYPNFKPGLARKAAGSSLFSDLALCLSPDMFVGPFLIPKAKMS